MLVLQHAVSTKQDYEKAEGWNGIPCDLKDRQFGVSREADPVDPKGRTNTSRPHRATGDRFISGPSYEVFHELNHDLIFTQEWQAFSLRRPMSTALTQSFGAAHHGKSRVATVDRV